MTQPKQTPPGKIGVLLTNLGTPDAPQKKEVRAYLKQFLWDPRVIEVPRVLWWFILNIGILNIRPARSAAAYRQVWTERGSPLMFHTLAQADALRERLTEKRGERVRVEFAMRYGNPGIDEVIDKMLSEGVEKLLVLPLYPQYSGATTASTFDAIAQAFAKRRALPQLRFVEQYHEHPAYIAALTQSILDFRAEHGASDKLIFSYHGVPQSYIDKGDPYQAQCQRTTQCVVEALGLTEDEYLVTFQSRVGRAQWLLPYTDAMLKTLPGQGVKSVQMIAPGFSSDCLETLQEIDVENREYFLGAGGEQYAYIPCLNSSSAHIDCIEQIVTGQLDGWLT